MWDRALTEQADLEPGVITMFVTSVEVPGPPAEDANERPVATDSIDQALLQRQGTGTWPNGDRAVRLGNAEEILITLPTDPFRAIDVARSWQPFTPNIAGLRIDGTSRRDGRAEVSWHGALRSPIRWRDVSVRLYASPSLNVTVVTIVPDKARKISSRSFVRVGLRVARQFGRQIQDGCGSLPTA